MPAWRGRLGSDRRAWRTRGEAASSGLRKRWDSPPRLQDRRGGGVKRCEGCLPEEAHVEGGARCDAPWGQAGLAAMHGA
ncbi:hypothetical protein PR202_ga30230 [Eleusine coracana subsp. coracana]|uniref:Uncharacterized protein n=1 Tax=Eleusine coracana subsp. coracana TaxID=191504 RepID=A0AAV5DNF3_ELECO|nr:hypothetical protein PR202_ga30230 [Eleusine coracana subsp. coracana]